MLIKCKSVNGNLSYIIDSNCISFQRSQSINFLRLCQGLLDLLAMDETGPSEGKLHEYFMSLHAVAAPLTRINYSSA